MSLDLNEKREKKRLYLLFSLFGFDGDDGLWFSQLVIASSPSCGFGSSGCEWRCVEFGCEFV